MSYLLYIYLWTCQDETRIVNHVLCQTSCRKLPPFQKITFKPSYLIRICSYLCCYHLWSLMNNCLGCILSHCTCFWTGYLFIIIDKLNYWNSNSISLKNNQYLYGSIMLNVFNHVTLVKLRSCLIGCKSKKRRKILLSPSSFVL